MNAGCHHQGQDLGTASHPSRKKRKSLCQPKRPRALRKMVPATPSKMTCKVTMFLFGFLELWGIALPANAAFLFSSSLANM
eukprot:1137724-Pelagomonas_calceolata.AAC.2